MADTFDSIDILQAQKLVTDLTPEWLKTNRLFYEGDHWQDGKAWIGPQPKAGEENSTQGLAEIKKTFTSRNAVAEVCERHSDAVVGREPAWRLVPREEGDGEPSDEQASEIEKVTRFLQKWWDKRKVLDSLEDATTTLLWASRSALRLFIPRGLLETDEANPSIRKIPPGTVEEMLDLVYMDHPEPETSTVFEDPDTMRELGIVVWEDVDAKNQRTRRGELTCLDDTDKTEYRIFTDGIESEAKPSWDFGGRLPVYEMTRTLLITEQVRQAQRALNLANTMIPRNVTTSGFLERLFLDAQMPGTWEKDSDGVPSRFVPDPVEVGSGSINYVQGTNIDQEDGSVTHNSPSVHFQPPTDPGPSDKAKRSHYRDILEEVDQAHVLMTSDAIVSGRSREIARADFEAGAIITKTQVDRGGRWLLETALAMAEAFSGEAGKYTDKYRIMFTANVSAGPVAPERQQENSEQVGKGLLSRRTAMRLNGIDDVTGELDMIREEGRAMLDLRTQQIEVIGLFRDVFSDVDVAVAARLAGMSEAEAAEFGQLKIAPPAPVVPPTTEPPPVVEEEEEVTAA